MSNKYSKAQILNFISKKSHFNYMIQHLHAPSKESTVLISFYVDGYRPHVREGNLQLRTHTGGYIHLVELLRQVMGTCLER